MRRIVLDTNCLLMCVSSKSPYHKVWTEFVEGKVAWCVSTEILWKCWSKRLMHGLPR